MRVVCDAAILDAEAAFGGNGVDDLCLLPSHQITADTVRGADALIIRSTVTVDKKLLAQHTPRFIATATIGSDHVDKELLTERGATFLTAQGSSAASVAQFTWALLVHLAAMQSRPVSSYRLGVVGCGEIGERVARGGESMGLEVLRVDPILHDHNPDGPCVTQLESCDMVTLHCPLERGGGHPTFEMVDETWLNRLPAESILVNTARGSLVNRHDLLAVLKSGRLRAIALDVFPSEPAVDEDLLAVCSLATAHIAGRSFEGMAANTAVIAAAFRNHFGLGTYEPAPHGLPEPRVEVSPATRLVDFVTDAWNLPALSDQLKSVVRGSDVERAAAFRALRKPPYRRDLSSFALDGRISDELACFLEALRGTNIPIDRN